MIKIKKEFVLTLCMSILTGALTGLLGSLFQLCINGLHQAAKMLVYSFHAWPLQYFFSILISIISIALSVYLVKRFAPEAAGSGVQEIEGVLEGRRKIRLRMLPVKFFGGILSISSGLVLGREGPSIQMGGGIGKLIHDFFKLDSNAQHLLVAAGAGAGLAVAFNAPLAGILFVIEEMRSQFKFNFQSFQCIILACVCSDIVLRAFMGQQAVLPMMSFQLPPLSSLWLFIIFGVIFGVMGVIFNRYLLKTMDFYRKLSKKAFWCAIILLSIVVGIASISAPDILGGGYVVIPKALSGQIGVNALLFIFIIRFFTTWFSFGSGTPGGIFAPMLALGTLFGMWFGHYAHVYFPHLIADPGVFSVAGMSALFVATVGAPLTGIVLVVEMTMNYHLILPLILTCFMASITTKALGGEPIYTTLLERTLKDSKD